MRSYAKSWQDEQYDFEAAMRTSKAEANMPEDEVHELDDDTQRRLTITQALVDTTAPTAEATGELWGEIHDDSLQDDSLRGDVARAFKGWDIDHPYGDADAA